MTVSNTASVVVVQGNGAQTVFNYGFEIPMGGGYALYLRDSAGNITLLASSVYSVSGIGNSAGGTFTYPLAGNTPMAAGNALIFKRVTPNEQLTALGNQGAYYPQVVEAALDWLTFQIQEIANQLTLAVQAPAGDNALNTLVAAVLRANGYLGFDANGQPMIVGGAPGTIPISTAMVPVVQAATLLAALAALGAAALAGSDTQTFSVADATPATQEAVPISQADARYAALAGDGSQAFAVANATPATQDAVPISQADARYAALAGLDTQLFSVANATGASNAVALGQSLAGAAAANVTASRALGTVYTNSSNRALVAMIMGNGAAAGDSLALNVNGHLSFQANTYGAGAYVGGTVVVGPGETYEAVGSGFTLSNWMELN